MGVCGMLSISILLILGKDEIVVMHARLIPGLHNAALGEHARYTNVFCLSLIAEGKMEGR
jgi:hypothetical protein